MYVCVYVPQYHQKNNNEDGTGYKEKATYGNAV